MSRKKSQYVITLRKMSGTRSVVLWPSEKICWSLAQSQHGQGRIQGNEKAVAQSNFGRQFELLSKKYHECVKPVRHSSSNFRRPELFFWLRAWTQAQWVFSVYHKNSPNINIVYGCTMTYWIMNKQKLMNVQFFIVKQDSHQTLFYT